MPNKRLQNILIDILLVVTVSAACLVVSTLYVRQRPLAECKEQSNPLAGISASCNAETNNSSQIRGWPTSFGANIPQPNSGDSEVDEIRISEYKEVRNNALKANTLLFVIVWGVVVLAYRFVQRKQKKK